jgi:glutathione S-transferase
MDTTKELIEVARPAFKVEGDEAKTAAITAFVTKDFKDAAVAFAAILAGKDFLVGADKGSLSLANIVVYYLCNGLLASRMPDKDQFMGMLKQIGIGDLIDRVGDLPKIKEWNEKCAAAAEAKAQAEN